MKLKMKIAALEWIRGSGSGRHDLENGLEPFVDQAISLIEVKALTGSSGWQGSTSHSLPTSCGRIGGSRRLSGTPRSGQNRLRQSGT